jgi:hypothetical protein
MEENIDGYLPVFDKEYPQNTISNRMAKNFDRYENKISESELVTWKSAGLKVYQPATMDESDQFTGFIDPVDGVTILVTTNPFSMEQTTSQLVADTVRGGNSKTIYTREMKVGDQKGVLYLTRTQASETEYFTKRVLAFGDDDFSWIITATSMGKSEAKHGEEILKMLLNVQLVEEGPVANGDEVDFEITPNRLVVTNGFVDKLVFTKSRFFRLVKR